MRIKVNPKEKLLTCDKSSVAGGGSRKLSEKGAQMCNFSTTIITCGSKPVFKLRRFSPWQTNATFCVKPCFCATRLLTRLASVPAAPPSMPSVQLPCHLKQWPFLHVLKKCECDWFDFCWSQRDSRYGGSVFSRIYGLPYDEIPKIIYFKTGLYAEFSNDVKHIWLFSTNFKPIRRLWNYCQSPQELAPNIYLFQS